jgi:hypothetical protein
MSNNPFHCSPALLGFNNPKMIALDLKFEKSLLISHFLICPRKLTKISHVTDVSSDIAAANGDYNIQGIKYNNDSNSPTDIEEIIESNTTNNDCSK